MSKNKEKLIDDFLLGKLDEEQLKEFERLLEEDDGLKRETDLTRYIIKGLQKKGESAVLDEIQALSSKKELEKIVLNAEKEHRKKSRKVLYSLVSIGVASIIFIILYVGIQPAYTTDSLHKEYYKITSYENIPIRDGGVLSNEQLELKAKAGILFEKREYAQALVSYNKLLAELNTQSIPEDIKFYSAICMVEIGQYDNAIKELKSLYENGIYFDDKAGWNLALCYLKKGNREDTKGILKNLIDNDTEYKDVSKELLSKINKKKLF